MMIQQIDWQNILFVGCYIYESVWMFAPMITLRVGVLAKVQMHLWAVTSLRLY